MAQNAPVVEKAAPKSNNTLPSHGTLGSNSGVNPAGNPGTIISYSGNSNSINTKTEPNPNIEPGTFLTSSPQGTVMRIPGVNNPNIQAAPVAAPVAVVESKPVQPAPVQTATSATLNPPTAVNNNIETINSTSTLTSSSPEKTTTIVMTDNIGKQIPAYTPITGNYVPQEIINKVKTKYGDVVYDIKAARIVSNNKIVYIVRLSENGKLRNELFVDEQ